MGKKKEIIIEKSIHLPKTLSGFITIFLVVLIIVNAAATIYMWDKVDSIQNEIIRLEDKIESKHTGTISNPEEMTNNYYRELSDKTDDAIDRILAIVGSLATIVTFFGLLLTYKAPHDMDKRIDEVKEVGMQAKEAAEVAKYQTRILEAINVDYNGNLTNAIRIKQISEVIDRFPNKSDAYMYRGFLYDVVSKNYDEEKRREYLYKAITDYKIAMELGEEKSSCLMDIGVEYSHLGEYDKAIQYYNKAIEINPKNAAAYSNRGGDYAELGEYEKALKDFERAISMESECFEFYIGRNYTYHYLWKRETDADKRDNYIDLQIADLKKAIDLNPENPEAQNMLKNLNADLKKCEIYEKKNIDFTLSQVNENLGFYYFKDGDYTEAYKHYLEAIEYYGMNCLIGNASENDLLHIEEIAEKINNIDVTAVDWTKLHEKHEIILEYILASISVELYKEKEKRIAEMLFVILLKYGDDTAALNLAFMKRRDETIITEQSVEELLDMYENKDSAIWRINKALCIIQNEDVAALKEAVEMVKMSKENCDKAIEWWDDEDVVGRKEKNIVFLLIVLSGVFSYNDEITLKKRIDVAREDGYNI